MSDSMKAFKVWLAEPAAKSLKRGEGMGDWRRFLEDMKEEIEVWLDAA